MTDWDAKRQAAMKKADQKCHHAHYYAVGNVLVVVTTAILAMVAAVSAQADVAVWVTTGAAGMTAGLAIITAAYKFQEKSATRQWLASDYQRLAGRYEELIGLDEPPSDVLDKLEAISSSLFRDTPVTESDWAEARPSASNALGRHIAVGG
jgi:hypothetical protein